MTALISGGCMRLYSTGPEWHVNAEHSTIGLIDGTVQPTIDASGFLAFNLVYGGLPNSNPVVSMTAASDETLTALGISAGCSNGGPLCRIRLYKIGVGALDLNDPAHWAHVDGAYANLWITLVHDVPEPV
jgi:hypothetical protein